MSKTELRAQWEKRIADFQASGQTGTAWCKCNQINIHQFRYWTRKFQLERQAQPAYVKWLSVEMDDSPLEEDTPLTIQVGQASIHVKSGFNPTLLKQVVQALAHA